MAEGTPTERLEIRVEHTIADLVQLQCVVHRADGSHYVGGILIFPSDEWHRWIERAFVGPGVVVIGPTLTTRA